MLDEVSLTCPYCWETIVLEVDVSGGSACYTEDCPVCCQPMTVWLEVEPGTAAFTVRVEAENG